MTRDIGEVWRIDWSSKKPWAVQGPGAVAHYRTKKEARWVGNLFLHVLEQKLERERMINAGSNTTKLSTGDAPGECENDGS